MSREFVVYRGVTILFKDLGLEPEDILRTAELPRDLFSKERITLSTAQYFRLWEALQSLSGRPTFPLEVGLALSVESFDPAVFAALCSPNLAVALQRLQTYKRLICPMRLHFDTEPRGARLAPEWLDRSVEPPQPLVMLELIFFVQLARLATRHQVVPEEVVYPFPVSPERDYAEYFGVLPKRGDRPSLVFSQSDLERPFLTADENMWNFFEPELRRRLAVLDQKVNTEGRVRASLLELLPSGRSSIEDVSEALGMSKRTLQRRLKSDGSTFQSALDKTREQLARHYLLQSPLSGAEISFLLGYDNPNSFFRAFRSWTGQTPEQVRKLASVS